jgi:hypothetical protein
MSDKDAVIERIRQAFGGNEHPGDQFLQGSFEGCEPYDEVGPFTGKTDWQSVEADFLDAHASALSFFSEAGFRFFLPAYLIADVHGQLKTADPLFHVTHGFSDSSVEIATNARVFLVKIGKSVLVNPRRYGALATYDYARYRLSVFAREEAAAIVAYLKYKRDCDEDGFNTAAIDAALSLFWLERAETAPTVEELRRHVKEQEEYFAALCSGHKEIESGG